MYLEQIFTQILKMSMTAGGCILIVLALHLIFYKVPKKYLYALWLVVAFRLLCPFSVSTPVGIFPLEQAAVGTGVAAVILIVAAFLLLGSNRSNSATNDGQTQTGGEVTADAEVQAAELLYEARNPYVGDISADGKLLRAIAQARPDSLFADLAYKTELQTSKEPYEFHFLLETDVTDGTEDQIISYVDIDQAQSLLGVDNLKAYAESPEKVRELLELVKQMNVEN